MRLTHFMIIIVAAVLFLIPIMRHEKQTTEPLREAQEAEPWEEIPDGKSNTFKVTYSAMTPDEEAIVDIIWMRKAAEMANDEGMPYFNILKQRTQRRFVKKYNMELSTITGIIQLDPDPMRAEFDANEIESLIMTD